MSGDEITLDTDLTKIKTSGKRSKGNDRIYWTCKKCGGRNHFSTDSCTVSYGCLAAYWRGVQQSHLRQANEAGKAAALCEEREAKEHALS